MRTTLTLDDDLLAQAHQISGLTERTQLIREALLALVPGEEHMKGAISMPDSDDPELVAVVNKLRVAGEIVINCLSTDPDPRCDRHLLEQDNEWRVTPLEH